MIMSILLRVSANCMSGAVAVMGGIDGSRDGNTLGLLVDSEGSDEGALEPATAGSFSDTFTAGLLRRLIAEEVGVTVRRGP